MSRVLMINLESDDVVTRCMAADVVVSAIERLPEGGVRLVCMSGEGAVTMRRKLKKFLIGDDPRRERHRPTRPLW